MLFRQLESFASESLTFKLAATFSPRAKFEDPHKIKLSVGSNYFYICITSVYVGLIEFNTPFINYVFSYLNFIESNTPFIKKFF